jgi:hypothetical protein
MGSAQSYARQSAEVLQAAVTTIAGAGQSLVVNGTP